MKYLRIVLGHAIVDFSKIDEEVENQINLISSIISLPRKSINNQQSEPSIIGMDNHNNFAITSTSKIDPRKNQRTIQGDFVKLISTNWRLIYEFYFQTVLIYLRIFNFPNQKNKNQIFGK